MIQRKPEVPKMALFGRSPVAVGRLAGNFARPIIRENLLARPPRGLRHHHWHPGRHNRPRYVTHVALPKPDTRKAFEVLGLSWSLVPLLPSFLRHISCCRKQSAWHSSRQTDYFCGQRRPLTARIILTNTCPTD